MPTGVAYDWLTDSRPDDAAILRTGRGPREVTWVSPGRARLVTPERVAGRPVAAAGEVTRFPPDRWEFVGEVRAGAPPARVAEVRASYRLDPIGTRGSRLTVDFRFDAERWTVRAYLRWRGAALKE
jgi:hypothetical protein